MTLLAWVVAIILIGVAAGFVGAITYFGTREHVEDDNPTSH